MPYLLKILAVVGTAAMIWVGGGILIHGLEEYGVKAPAHAIHDAAASVAGLVPVAHGFVEWLVTAAASGLVGLAVGALLIPVTSYVIARCGGGRGRAAAEGGLERFPTKWMPVRRKKARLNKGLEMRPDPTRSGAALTPHT